MGSEQELRERLESVRSRIAAAAQRAGRAPEDVRLVAVSKTVPAERVAALARLGVDCFGENRVEEAVDKLPQIREILGPEAYDRLRWCLIGHLQSRKVHQAVTLFDEIHSLDSLRLAMRLDRQAADLERPLPVLLEINISGEASKFGLPAGRWPEDAGQSAALYADIEAILALPHLAVQGLMTIAPLVADPEQARPFFRRLRQLRDALRGRFPEGAWRELSMGMSDDYEVAIEEGSTMVRLGRALFGPRG